MLVMGDMPWANAPTGRFTPPPSGWVCRSASMRQRLSQPADLGRLGSYHIEDYVAQAQAFQTQLTSLIVEGVFARHRA